MCLRIITYTESLKKLTGSRSHESHEQGVMSHIGDDRRHVTTIDKQPYCQAVSVYIYMYSNVARKGNAS